MPIRFACEQCGKEFSVDPALAGKRVKCKACGTSLTVPAPGVKARPPAADDVDDPYDLGAGGPRGGTAGVVERPLPRGTGGRGGRGPEPSGGVPVWVWLAGGAVGLVLVVLAGAAIVSRPRGPQPVVKADVGDAPGAVDPSEDDRARFKKDEVSTASGAPKSAWRVKADPLPEPLVFSTPAKMTITVPESYSGFVLYPTTPSAFVIIGGNDNEKHYREVIDLRTGTPAGRLSGKIEASKPMALSPDGEYFVARSNPVPRSTDVWRISDATRVAKIVDGKELPDYVDFAGPGKLVIGTSYAKVYQVWDFLAGKPLAKIQAPERVINDSIAYSPGRRYMAFTPAGTNKVQVFDTTTGHRAGEIDLSAGGNQGGECEGLAFSPDGASLAGVFRAGNETHIHCWDAANGKEVSDFRFEGNNPFGKSFAYHGQAIQWLPDQSGWLLNDQTFVERQNGQIVWSEAFPPIQYKVHGPRRVLDLGRMVALGEVNGRQVLRVVALKQDKIAGAIALSKGGQNAIDAVLPPVVASDTSGAKTVSAVPGPVPWSGIPGPATAPAPAPAPAASTKAAAGKAAAGKATATPTPTPAATAAGNRPIPTRVTAGDVLTLVVSPAPGAQALVVSSPAGRLSDVKGKQSQQPRTVTRVDLAAGRTVDTFEIPSVATPIAFAPGAARFLVAYPASPDRLDVHDAAGGKPLAGWRPYDKESGGDRDVAWAEFLDAGRVLTVSKAGTLALWSVPGCKAVYVAGQAMQGVPVLSPNRKSLAVLRAGALRLIDPETGEPQGDGTASGHPGAAGLTAAGFSPDGQELVAVLDDMLVLWDMKTGQVAGETPSPVPKPSALQYGNARHVLLDNKVVFDLESKRVVWNHSGGVHAQGNTGAVHRYIASKEFIGPGVLSTLDVPDKQAVLAETALANPKAPAMLREGSRVSIRIEGQPDRDAEGFRRELVEGLTAQLQAVGVEVADDQPVKVVVKFSVKETGRSIEFRKFTGKPGGDEKRTVRDRLLEWELLVADDKGAPVPIARDTVKFTATGFFENIPNDERDWEGYLRARQYAAGAKAALKYGVPYFVARGGTGGYLLLPGRSALGFPTS